MNTVTRVLSTVLVFGSLAVQATGRMMTTAHYTVSTPERDTPLQIYVLGGQHNDDIVYHPGDEQFEHTNLFSQKVLSILGKVKGQRVGCAVEITPRLGNLIMQHQHAVNKDIVQDILLAKAQNRLSSCVDVWMTDSRSTYVSTLARLFDMMVAQLKGDGVTEGKIGQYFMPQALEEGYTHSALGRISIAQLHQEQDTVNAQLALLGEEYRLFGEDMKATLLAVIPRNTRLSLLECIAQTPVHIAQKCVDQDTRLGDISFELAFEKALSCLDTLIIVCGAAHALSFYQFMEKRCPGVQPELVYGYRDKDLLEHDDIARMSKKKSFSLCSTDEVSTVFDHIASHLRLSSDVRGAAAAMDRFTVSSDRDSIREPIKKVCRFCNVECSLKCVRCKKVFYCSADHQKKDWPTHKLTCSAQ